MDKLKILYIINSLGKGGAERLLIDTCRELKNRNEIEYLILSLSPVNDYREDSKELNIEYCNATVNLSILRKSKIQLEEFDKIINTFKPDIIHSHLYIAEIVSRERNYNNITYVTHLHGYEEQFENFSINTILSKRKFINWYEKQRLIKKYKNCNNYFIAISSYVENCFYKSMPSAFSDKIVLLHNAIDFKRFHNDNKKSLNNNDCTNLINTGSFSEKKNQQFLLSVFKVIKEKGIDLQLTLLGNGDEFEKIQKLAGKIDFDKQIIMPGNVINVEDYLFLNHIYVHSAIYEPFGLVLLEAMAAGLPVVSLDGKGNRDIIKNGYNGFMIEKPDANLFAEKIIELISNTELYSTMSENAVKFAADYDIKKYVDKLIKYYYSLK